MIKKKGDPTVHRKIVVDSPLSLFEKDLEKYCESIIEMGATKTKIVTINDIIIDERVRAKCTYPKCRFHGTNAHCPPYAMELPDVRLLLSKYERGIFFDIEVPPDVLSGPDTLKTRAYVPSGLNAYKIVGKIEAEAFYDGYHLALGFGVGPCKPYFCENNMCTALEVGVGCKHPLRARSSMESMGMDVFTMAANAGWDIYPIGGSTSPEEVPVGHRLGLVLIR
jgi:predicted metal-binding protein